MKQFGAMKCKYKTQNVNNITTTHKQRTKNNKTQKYRNMQYSKSSTECKIKTK